MSHSTDLHRHQSQHRDVGRRVGRIGPLADNRWVSTDAPAPPRIDRALIDRLRADLAELAAPADLLTAEAQAALARSELTPARMELAPARTAPASAPAPATRTTTPATAFWRLALLGEPVPERDLRAALPTATPDALVRLGLAERSGAELLLKVDLTQVDTPTGPLWLTSDLPASRTGRALHPEHVLGVGGASLTLAGITDRRPRATALDLGTGCGIQAALLAGHIGRVTATDVSTRALAFAAFNAALNGQTWDLRRGSFFAPAPERFDLIVSNPPFVLTPPTVRAAGLPRYEYRDAALSDDDAPTSRHLTRGGGAADGGVSGGDGVVGGVLGLVLAGLPGHLNPGGSAQLLANWEYRDGVGPEAIGAPGLDTWVIEREVLEPAEYVELWLRDASTAGTQREAAYRAWLADFRARGVTAVGFGYVLARPSVVPADSDDDATAASHTPDAGAAVRRVERVTGPATMPVGEALARGFNWLQTLGSGAAPGADSVPDADFAPAVDSALDAIPSPGAAVALDQVRPVVAPDVTIERHYRPGEADPAVILARQGGGLGRAVQLDTAAAALYSAADGELTVSQLAAAIAALTEPEAAQRVREAAREGLITGLLRAE